jgi:hypothetical protein
MRIRGTFVIPAESGNPAFADHVRSPWVPAFAGMTEKLTAVRFLVGGKSRGNLHAGAYRRSMPVSAAPHYHPLLRRGGHASNSARPAGKQTVPKVQDRITDHLDPQDHHCRPCEMSGP